MRRLPLFVLIGILAGCSQRPAGDPAPGHDHDHGEHRHGPGGPKINLHLVAEPEKPVAGGQTTLKLTVHGPDGEPVKDFESVHDARAHLIVVRKGLDRFAHLHPEVGADGKMTAKYAFPAGGVYYLFLDHKRRGQADATATTSLLVGGDAADAPALTPDVPGEVKADGLRARVSVIGAKAGGEGTIRFEIADHAGKPVADLQPYMGAMGHLVVISQDGKQYVHAHPAGEQKTGGNVVAFGAHFPKAGLYKGWGQFKRDGEVRVVPFVLRVE